MGALYEAKKALVLAVRSVVERVILSGSKVGAKAFFERGEFPWVADIEACWKDIRAELDHVLNYQNAIPNFQDISKEQIALTQDDRWKTYIFSLYGRRIEENCSACPKTAAALALIPGMTTAFFSILYPKKHLAEHRGPYNGVLRYHLALKVPEPASACAIRVGSETRNWEEGKSLIFDDSYPHEAWNNTEGVRVVLFVDFKRPLTFPLSLVNDAVMALVPYTSFITEAVRRQARWLGAGNRIPKF